MTVVKPKIITIRVYKTAILDIDYIQRVSKLCTVLNRNSCKEVLANKGVLHEVILSNKYQIAELLFLLKMYYDDFRDEIVPALEKLANIQEGSRNYLDRNLISIAKTPHVVKEILALGVDANGDAPAENSLFLRILQRLNMYNSNVRETTKLLIGANPDLNLQHGVVELAISQDEFMHKTEKNTQSMGAGSNDLLGTYITDAKQHGLFGYDDCAFALNFAAPFFMECGFPVSRSVLEDSVFKNLHPDEINYIQTYLDNPKPLKAACRDALRQKFKGLKIKQFLEKSNCPQKLQDFILMKSLLIPIVFQGSAPYLYPNRCWLVHLSRDGPLTHPWWRWRCAKLKTESIYSTLYTGAGMVHITCTDS